MKKGILLVAFGTLIPEALKSLSNAEAKISKIFPDMPIFWAYTSRLVRQKLTENAIFIDSPEIALAKLMDNKFTHVVIQSFHVINGKEFHDIYKDALCFKNLINGFEQIAVSPPLLTSDSDFEKVSNGILKNIPKERKKEDAVILMGHGTSHPSNASYVAMLYFLQRKDPNIFIGTVSNYSSVLNIHDIKANLISKNIKKAYLMPFMSIAGNHVKKDMIGDKPDSWENILKNSGISCSPIIKGLLDYEEIINIWIEHLEVSMRSKKL